MCVLILSTTLSETLLIVRIIQQNRSITTNCIGLHVNWRYYCQILTKPEFLRQFFEKTEISNFTKQLFSGSRGAPCGRTERQSLFST